MEGDKAQKLIEKYKYNLAKIVDWDAIEKELETGEIYEDYHRMVRRAAVGHVRELLPSGKGQLPWVHRTNHEKEKDALFWQVLKAMANSRFDFLVNVTTSTGKPHLVIMEREVQHKQ